MPGHVNVEGTFTPVPFAKETIDVSSTAIGLTAATYNPGTQGQQGAVMAWITCAADNVRYWLDGSTPTATVGHVLTAGDGIEIGQAALSKFLAIRQTTDAKLSVTYFSTPPTGH